jgi:preprotein translocase subunit SecD
MRPRIALLLGAAVLLLATLGGVLAFGGLSTSGHRARSTDRSKGGLEVVLRTEGRSLTAREMQRSVRIMFKRLAEIAGADFELRARGSSEISLWLGGVPGVSRALNLVTARGELEFFDLETSLAGRSLKDHAPKPLALYPLLKAAASESTAHGASSYYLFRGHRLLAGPVTTKAELLALTKSAVRSGDTVLGVPKSAELVSCDLKTSRYCPGGMQAIFVPKPGETWYYLFRLPPQLTNMELNTGGIRADSGPMNGPVVNLAFTRHGDKVFQEITRDEWTRGQAGSPQHFAVVLDGRLITFPQIDPRDTLLRGGIDPSYSGVPLAGIGSVKEAKNLAVVLQNGALPADFRAASIKHATAAPSS